MTPNIKSVILAATILIGSTLTVLAQSGQRQVPAGFCSLASMSSAKALSACQMASFTGTGSGNNFTASAVTGLILPGEILAGTGAPSGTVIQSQLSGSPGGAGIYVTNSSVTSVAASLTANGIPYGANYAMICAYVQGVVWRDDGVAPTGTPGTGGNGISSGQCFSYNGTFSSIQFIQQASGAILGISIYK
jgi:hypothetical protein